MTNKTKTNITLRDVWDFHTDVKFLVIPMEGGVPKFRSAQFQLPTCQKIGGIFSAVGLESTGTREGDVDRFHKEINACIGIPGTTIVRSTSDIQPTGNQILHAEGVYFITESSLDEDLQMMWDKGVRSFAPLYNADNNLGGGARGNPKQGLTDLGKKCITNAYEMGFLIDSAHCNYRTQQDLIGLATKVDKPLSYTHGHLGKPHLPLFGERGTTEELIVQYAKTGGLVGLSPHPGFQGTYERFLDEVSFLAEAIPEQAVLGSDFAGISTPPETFAEIPNAESIPIFAEQLSQTHGKTFAENFCSKTLYQFVCNQLSE